MLKCYRLIDNKPVAYHEAWLHESIVVEHWGQLGDRGASREHRADRKLSNEDNLLRVLAAPMAVGFRPIDIDDHAILLIEYAIEGMGSPTDLDKRHALEDRMNETLGWTGLGFCDGGSNGSGTMEVCCFVVDFATAKRTIEKDLADTEFGNFARIFEEVTN